MLGQVRGSTCAHPARARRRPAHSRLNPKLRKHDGIRFHGGVEWGMVGGSRARAAADGAMGTALVNGRARRAVTATVLGGALSLLASGCGGGSEDADDDPRPTTPESETTTTLDAEEAARQEVITAREAADEAQIEALAPPTPDPELPALEETHTGLMLDRMTQTANGLKVAGIASRLPEDTQHSLEVESIRFGEAEGVEVAYIEVCIVEDAERIDPATNQVLKEGVVTARSTEAMQKIDGVWKLAERRQDSVEEGVVGCAVD